MLCPDRSICAMPPAATGHVCTTSDSHPGRFCGGIPPEKTRGPLASAVGLSRTCALGRYVLVSERVAGVDARGDVAVRTTLGAVVIDRPHQLRSAPGAFLHAAADVGASGQPLRDLFLLRYLSSVPEVHPAALAQVPVHAGFRRNRYTVDRGVSRSHEKAGALKRSQS